MQVITTMENDNGFQWFALRTRYQHENRVATALECKEIKSFLPTYKLVRRWNDRMKVLSAPLFPGYVFAASIGSRMIDVLNTPGVAAIVSVAGIPAEIPAGEIEAIRRTLESRSKVEPHEYLESGDEVRITYGPLAGLEGILVRKRNELRLLISIKLLGRAVAIEMDAMNLESTRNAWSQALPS